MNLIIVIFLLFNVLQDGLITGINVADSVNTNDKYKSKYTETLYALIENYVSNNNISKKRIYIGGASKVVQ